MICENKQPEIIHREILLFFFIIKRGWPLLLLVWAKTDNCFSFYEGVLHFSQDHHCVRKWAWNYQVISIRFHFMVTINFCLKGSCINKICKCWPLLNVKLSGCHLNQAFSHVYIISFKRRESVSALNVFQRCFSNDMKLQDK